MATKLAKLAAGAVAAFILVGCSGGDSSANVAPRPMGSAPRSAGVSAANGGSMPAAKGGTANFN